MLMQVELSAGILYGAISSLHQPVRESRAGVVPRRFLPRWRDLSKHFINHESGTQGSAASFRRERDASLV
jgi:hypothetical protein